MKTIKYLIIAVFVLGSFSLKAQQMPHYTQYMLNDYIVNPAFAGLEDYFQAKANYRYQWAGIVDAPVTYVLSLYGPHRTKDMGYGGYIFNDVTGPTSRSGFYGSYSYIVKLKEGMNLSFGLSVGFLQYKIDGTKIDMLDIEDPSIQSTMYTAKTPDATFGTLLKGKNYYAGLSVAQLLNNKLEIYNPQTASLNKLKSHLYILGGYKYAVNDKFTAEPSVLFKMTGPAPPSFEISAKAVYRDAVWAGLSYRSADALAVIIGYNYKDQLFFGYSYDISMSSLSPYTSGSHEIMISARFNKIKNFDTEEEPTFE